MQRIIWGAVLVIAITVAFISPVRAGELDVLVDKLVEKGILTSNEAKIIIDETRQQVAKDLEQGKSDFIPGWAQKISLKGDFRLRYQYERRRADSEARTRGRYRCRLGADAKVNDKTKIGFGLATGGTDPRSTNQTFNLDNGTSFGTPDIRLDLAFAEYQPITKFSIVGGKFKTKPYLYTSTDMLWESDINPEGMSMHWEDALASINDTDYWINTGVWSLKTNDQVDRPDVFMPYVQAGIKNKAKIMGKSVDSKLATTFYSFQGLHGETLLSSAGGNTTGSGGVFGSNYNSLGVSTEAGVTELFGGLPLKIDERIALIGDFVHNFDDSLIGNEKTSGWALGTKFGHAKVKEPGSWQMKYLYVILGANAFPDSFPDSDRFGGQTDVRSHEALLEYAWKKNIALGLDYYQTRHYARSGSDDTEHLIQADMVYKF
jgi:hypothetical protein